MAEACPNYLYCGDDWANLPRLDCATEFNGGMDLSVLLQCGITLADLTLTGDPDVLDPAKIEALINGGDGKVIEFVQIAINAPSAVSGPSYNPCKPEKVLNFDRSLSIVDPNVSEPRRQFWNSVSVVTRFRNGGMLIRECETGRWNLILGHVDIAPGRLSPENNGELQRFEIDVTYRSKEDPKIFEPIDVNLAA